MKACVYVTLKKGVLDPQGSAVAHALHSLGYESIKDVRQGKFFEIDLNTSSKNEAETILKKISDQVLANTVIEDFTFEIK